MGRQPIAGRAARACRPGWGGRVRHPGAGDHRARHLRGRLSVALGVLALALGALTAASMLTDDPPLSGSGRTVALVAAGMLATFGVNHLHRRASGA